MVNTMYATYMANGVRRYITNTVGAIAIAFALMAPVIIGAGGMALDFAQAYLVQQRLHQAIDAAALAAASSSNDESVIEQKVSDFFAANYPPEKIGAVFEPVVTISGSEITVSGRAMYTTFFLNVIGIDELEVEAETTVVREVQGIEVVLVLDNTGSMSTNNNIESLKDATESFIDILFDRTSNPEFIKIGMVPYANSVRVGRYGLGLTPDGDAYGDGNVFVNLPSGVSYTNDHTSDDWYGCVVEHEADGFDASATHVSGSKGQLWESGGDYDGHGWSPYTSYNDPHPDDVEDEYEGPWDIYSYGRIVSYNNKCSSYSGYSNSRCSNCTGSYGRCRSDYCFCWRSDSNNGTNLSCPKAYVMPLTSDRDALIDHIDEMQPHGNTLGNIGMVWGYRLLSPEPPFEEAQPWENEQWRKAVIMMTDGNNTRDGTYSSFWFRNKHNLSVTNFNERLEETCENMKEQGVVVYTVTFESGVSSNTRGFYERCASSEDQYYDAPTQQDLIEVFEQIARELSNLHISN